MSDSLDQNKQSNFQSRRFHQAVFVTVLMLILATISSFYFNETMNIKLFLIIDVLVMCTIFPLTHFGKINLAKQIYLWTNMIVLSYIFWSKGGLLSSAVILVYPMFLMISALLVGPRTFFLAYSFTVGLVILVSLQAINTYTNYTYKQFGYWDLSIVLILLSAAGFTAWRFNGDMRSAMKKLKSEVSNVNQSREEITRLIHFDSLTNLPSRLNSESKYTELCKNLDVSKDEISFLFVDIDNFKSINEFYNHSAGDAVLKQVSERLLGFLLEDDVACRLSGDEFLLIITRPKNYNIERFSKSVLSEISKPVEINKNPVEVTASLGIAIRDNETNEGFESLIKRADLAMYRAKQLGKNKHSFYDDELYQDINRKHRIIKGLKSALRNNDLELYLQPKVNIHTGKAESAEALIRWIKNNPEGSTPDEFIPLIESTELICELGDWVIKHACKMCKDMHQKGYDDLSISVNISSAQFMMGTLEKVIVNELQASKLEPKHLELELTEHILFQENTDVLDELRRIKELGVTLSIDDFGTGYSNLGYLTKFKVDTLKIDRSFVTDINKSSENYAIVDAIIKMAKTLGLSIVAEGVETQQEWDALKQLGCDQGQGYIWSRPLPSLEFHQHLSETV